MNKEKNLYTMICTRLRANGDFLYFIQLLPKVGYILIVYTKKKIGFTLVSAFYVVVHLELCSVVMESQFGITKHSQLKPNYNLWYSYIILISLNCPQGLDDIWNIKN